MLNKYAEKMTTDIIKNKTEQIGKILLAVIFVLAVLIVTKIASLAVSIVRTPLLINTAIAQGTVSKDKIAEYLAADSEQVDALKKKNMFMSPPPKPGPPSVIGILGKSALINGKWYKAGQEVAGAKVLRIEPTQIVIEWDGKEMPLAPILSAVASVKGDPNEKVPEKKNPRRRVERMQQESEQQSQIATEEDPLAWLGVKLSTALRAKFLEKWNQMSDEEKEQAKQGWNQMSDEQKQTAVNAMEQQL